MRLADILRYSLWLAVVTTARANRRRYGMPTTWVPHLVLNSVALLLPDFYRLLKHMRAGTPVPQFGHVASGAVVAVLEHPRRYVLCVAPFTAGYLLSHPDFDIYKGAMGRIRLAGFGLDALPHAATAAGVCLLVAEALPAAAREARPGRLQTLLGWSAQRPLQAAGIALAVLTVIWEVGEFLAYRYEIRAKGDVRQINMSWSLPDTARDCAANTAGWALAWLILRADHPV